MMRVLLVDDEPTTLRHVALELRALPDVDIVGVARNGDAAVDEVRRLNPDLVILNVEMPGRDGLSIVAELSRDNGPDIVFLAAGEHHAVVAFEVEALDYLLKPVQPNRLRQTVERARRRRAEKAAHLAATSNDAQSQAAPAIYIPDRLGGRHLPLAEIIWIEAARDYVLIHTEARTHILRATMIELAKRLPDTIMRVHRSTFVTLAHVRRWNSPAKGVVGLILSDGAEVTVGPTYIKNVTNALRSLDR
jgi:two-component system, LytTR family, response regulator